MTRKTTMESKKSTQWLLIGACLVLAGIAAIGYVLVCVIMTYGLHIIGGIGALVGGTLIFKANQADQQAAARKDVTPVE